MGGTARRLVLSFVLATAIYALPVVESTAAPEVAADSVRDWQPRLLASGEIWGATYTPDGTYVIDSERGIPSAYPVAGGPGVTLGSGSVVAALAHSPILLIRDGRELLVTDVGQTVLVTDDDKWAIANAGEQTVKIEISNGTVEPLPGIPGTPPHPGGIPVVDTVLNDVMYMAPLPEDKYEVRALNLDSGIDRFIGMGPTLAGSDELPGMSVASQPRLVVFGFDGGRTAGVRIYSIEPWELLHSGSYSSIRLTADGTTLFATYGSPSGTDTYAVDLETDETVQFGRFLDGGSTGSGLQVAADDRFASATMSDDNEPYTEAYVYDVSSHRALSLGEMTATVSSDGDAFLGTEPRTLINRHDARSFVPIGMFSVTVTGADPRPWPPFATRDQSFPRVTAYSVGDVAYAVGDIGLYRLNADGSGAVLVTGPLGAGERFDWAVASPSGDSLVYLTETETDRKVWLLRISPEFDPCSGSGVITGTAGNDEIVGTDADDVISGLGGNDVIDGKGGNDYICGGDGDDRLIGGDGNDVIFGGPGADTARGGRGRDVIQGGSGPDNLVGGTGGDFVYGGDGADSIRGRGGPDRLYGDAGDDRISGGGGADTILGGTGADTLAGNTGPDDISAVAGDNVINGGAGRDTLKGGSGDDRINGAAGNDSLSTTLGSDVLDGGDGDDTISLGGKGPHGIGGPGNDTITWGGSFWVDPRPSEELVVAAVAEQDIVAGAAVDHVRSKVSVQRIGAVASISGLEVREVVVALLAVLGHCGFEYVGAGTTDLDRGEEVAGHVVGARPAVLASRAAAD
jgi:Ca2+-binding RTX toxin-like protein